MCFVFSDIVICFFLIVYLLYRLRSDIGWLYISMIVRRMSSSMTCAIRLTLSFKRFNFFLFFLVDLCFQWLFPDLVAIF